MTEDEKFGQACGDLAKLRETGLDWVPARGMGMGSRSRSGTEPNGEYVLRNDAGEELAAFVVSPGWERIRPTAHVVVKASAVVGPPVKKKKH